MNIYLFTSTWDLEEVDGEQGEGQGTEEAGQEEVVMGAGWAALVSSLVHLPTKPLDNAAHQ